MPETDGGADSGLLSGRRERNSETDMMAVQPIEAIPKNWMPFACA